MPSSLSAYVLPAVMLAVLALGVTGGPVGDVPTENPSGDPSGEEQEDDQLSKSDLWNLIIGVIEPHKGQFEEEFRNSVNYTFLDNYEIPSPKARCRSLSKESCLLKLVQGLLDFKVLLKHVEKEYPTNSILPDAKSHSSNLVSLIKDKMKHRDRVTPLTGSQEEQLLQRMDNPNTFQRKMAAHSVLHHLRQFLIDGKRAVAKMEGSY